jgi:hypothetical protein
VPIDDAHTMLSFENERRVMRAAEKVIEEQLART